MNNFFVLEFIDNRKKDKSLQNRLLTISFLIAILGLVIIMRLVEVSFPNNDKIFIKTSEKEKLKKQDRGFILDRNDRIVASNIYIYNLKAYPKKIKKPKNTLSLLEKEIKLANREKILEKLKNKKKYEVIIVKNITAPQAKKVNDIGIPGIEFVPVMKRFYPHQELTSHYVGHVNDNMLGQLGAERTFNDELSLGKNVKLGLDIKVQYVVREELKKASIKYNVKSSTAIIADINNGEILSLVSLPDFNPNKSINPKANSYTNTATLNLYEMGSTFKIFSIAAALEKSKINLESKFDATKPIKISDYTIKDYKPKNKILSTKEVFLNSSNIGSSLIALELGKNNLKNFYYDLGLLTSSKINLDEKTKPIVPKKWGKIETATLSFGHGLSISPIQMVEAASKLFNNNKNFITKIHKKNNNQKIEKINFLSSNTVNLLKELMYENTIVGTAKKARLQGYNIGGKTATGEKPENGKYDKYKLVSSFLAIFPIEDPKYISLVLFDEPILDNDNKFSQGATGGLTAAPVTAKILRRIFPILGITKKFKSDEEIKRKDGSEFNLVSY
jgi:cell division protein FtsI (penicillin-binding protein 3)